MNFINPTESGGFAVEGPNGSSQYALAIARGAIREVFEIERSGGN